MRHYATLFDSRYLPQGLVLYESLKKHSSEPFLLHILAMNSTCELTLHDLDLPFAEVESLDEFEKYVHGMAEARANRTWQEYCWTCASNFAADILGDNAEEVTYIDSDCAFFSDPKVIHDEIGDRSIAVIPHRLIPSKKHLESNGRFNVSWVTFKNNPVGRECLSTWAAQCREKCSARDGCGDQKYLDAWPDKYGPELCVIQNIGAGLAPWNLANYGLYRNDMPPFLKVGLRWGQLGDWRKALAEPSVSVVFYHFHEYLHGARLTNYELRPEDIKLIYEPYIEAVSAAKAKIESLHIPAI